MSRLAWVACGAVLLLAIVTTGLAWLMSPERPISGSGSEVRTPPERGPAFAGRFVGDRACRECHPGETAQHARTGHARTLRPAWQSALARRLDGRSIADPEDPNVRWTFHTIDKSLEFERIEEEKTEHFPLEFAFGSGIHALTFVTTKSGSESSGPTAHEHRMSYYVETDKLDITPGQEASARPEPGTSVGPEGRSLDSGHTRKCFDCHSTLTSKQGSDRFDPASMMPNIGCERCHGPGREHVEDARRDEADLWMPHGSDQNDPSKQLLLCGECHRHPKDLNPTLINPANASIVRFQPVGLIRSECYRSGLSGLRCTTCHNPHARASADRAYYEAKCLACHNAAPRRLCSLKPSPRAGCVDCHMPRRRVPEGFLFTDHWIRKPDAPVPRLEKRQQSGRADALKVDRLSQAQSPSVSAPASTRRSTALSTSRRPRPRSG